MHLSPSFTFSNILKSRNTYLQLAKTLFSSYSHFDSGIALSEPITDEKLKRAVELANEVDIFSLMKIVINVLKAYGEFAKSVGQAQAMDPEAYELILELGKAAPQILGSIAKRSPPAVIGSFVQVSLRLLELQEKMEKMMQLSPEEKIKLGEEIIETANSYEQVLTKIKEEMG